MTGHESIWSSGPPEIDGRLRTEVRTFLADALANGAFVPRCDPWLAGFDPEFSRELGRRGWIGMTWPEEYGGHGRSYLDRFVVMEELLVAGAPVAAHWLADRQSGPQIHGHGTEELKQRVLPTIARGECYFATGMSEPDSGSDLASVRTRAERAPGGWRVSGRKVWTSHVHHCHFLTILCRTADADDKRDGLSVFALELPDDRIDVRPIRLLTGEHHFNEVVLDDAFVPDAMVIGEPGDGWRLITSELSFERSGPERVLSTYPLLAELAGRVAESTSGDGLAGLGALIADLYSLHQLSLRVAGVLATGADPTVEAALVKELGTRFEQSVPERARQLISEQPTADGNAYQRLLADAILASPGFTIRGGTNEILRGLVARGLGLR